MTAFALVSRQPAPLFTLLALSGLALMPTLVQAAEPRFEARLDRAEVAVGSSARLDLTLVDGRPSTVPRIAPTPGVAVNFLGEQRRIQSGTNMAPTTAVSFSYRITPLRVGRFQLGPFAIEAEGRELVAAPLELLAVPAAPLTEPRLERRDDLQIRVEVSPLEPYVGEQVLYVWRYFEGTPTEKARLGELQASGVQQQTLPDVPTYRANIAGREYRVHEVRRALFPERPGPLEIAGPTLSLRLPVQLGRLTVGAGRLGQSGGETRTLRSPTARLRVRPLPPKPPRFSWLIGQFELASSLSRNVVPLGGEAELKVTVTGRGNVHLIPEIDLPPLPQMRIFPDKPLSKLEPSETGLAGKKTFRYVLMPQTAGEHIIPALDLVYFDPKAEAYRTAKTQPQRLTVLPAPAEPAPATPSPPTPAAPTSEASPAPDATSKTVPLVAEGGAKPGRWLMPWLSLAGLGLVGLGALGWVVWRKRPRLANAREASAGERALARIPDIDNALAGGYLREAAELASRVLREYLGRRLGLEGSALTASEWAQRMRREAKLAPELAERTHRLLAALEATQFAACTTQPPCTGAELARLIEELERG